MGTVRKVKYRVEIEYGILGLTSAPGAWNVQRNGRPTNANLERYVLKDATSRLPGGVNYHITKAIGVFRGPHDARIVNQQTGATVATWKAAMFQVFG